MKKLLLLALSAFSITAYALPTYEPFTEFAAAINANGGSINLATGGYTAPSGEPWSALYFSGTAGTHLIGVDIYVTNAAVANSVFTYTALSTILPPTFPGLPSSGSAITNFAVNPAQPLVSGAVSPNIVGNSAVLKFVQDITRSTNGTTNTLFWSYLFSVAQKGQTGAGNIGRYMGFLASSNLNEGWIGNAPVAGAAYTNWNSMFNSFGTATNKNFGHGVFNGAPEYLEPCDNSSGKAYATPPTTYSATYGAPYFMVGEYVFMPTNVVSSSIRDTNILWVNPALGSFGGPTPPAPGIAYAMTNGMTDVGGLVLIDRPGSGSSGGAGTNYIANLIIGSTWSYVTGGPEFTNQPTSLLASIGDTVSLSGPAVAAGQTVSYTWQKVTGNTTNIVNNGTGGAGGAALVTGATGPVLTLSGISAADLGTYQVAATASGTGFTLTSSQAQIANMIFTSSQPQSVTVNYSSNATFTASVATTNATMSYAWYKGANPIVNGPQAGGSTASGVQGTTAGSSLTATLTLSHVSYLDDGSYTLFVTNNANNALLSTTPATLTVNDPIMVTQPQTNLMQVPVGSTTNLSIVAIGTAPLSYQWYGILQGSLSDGGGISGSATSTLTITNAQPSNSDNYYVIVSGPGGSVQSSNAIVYINSTALGPFSPTSWPTSIAPNAVVDYVVIDPTLAGTIQTPATWNNVMSVAGGSDQTFSTVSLGGMTGDQATGSYFNWVDPNWRRFVSIPQIDILILVYGNSTMYNNTNGGLPTTYSYGQVPNTVAYEHSGAFPLGANNGQWNWMLLSVTNAVDVNGYRTVGDTSFGILSGGTAGGINNGTIRLEAAWPSGSGPTIAAVAFGPHGAFGTSNQVNRFANPVSCAPEPTNNLAFIDFNQNLTNNLNVINDPNLGETYSVQSGVGPAGDPRTAIQSTSGQMEFNILNNYLGLPCNENLTMQLGMEVYDDPALAGTQFAPYQYATDSQGDLTTYLGQWYTLTGSGQWLKVAFYFGPANLQGVNTAPLTGGPTVLFYGGLPYIDRVELGVIRTGTNAVAGQIPDPNYYIAPLVTCSNGYGYYAEWYPTAGITNNVNVSGAYSIVSAVGPANDQRIAEVPNPIGVGSASYEQFALLNNVFGPAYQDNSDVIISVDYYDDPALTNNDLYPNTYNTMNNGNVSVVSPQSPYGAPAYLAGTGKWQTAVWELPNVNFTGAYLCRFASSAPVYISRVRFNVIRPCGTFEGIDYLQGLGMTVTNSQMSLNWRGQASLQSAPVVTGAYGNLLTVTNTVTNVYAPAMTNTARFFRLAWPGYPSYLSPYVP
jgi:hypothetical protein